jgi:hypothetical protein
MRCTSSIVGHKIDCVTVYGDELVVPFFWKGGHLYDVVISLVRC